MYQMYKKIAAKEKIVGWYHSGPKLRRNDLEIEEYLRKYIQTKSSSSSSCGGGVLVIVDVNPQVSAHSL
jgi:26S proteasome regulatory subunit N8